MNLIKLFPCRIFTICALLALVQTKEAHSQQNPIVCPAIITGLDSLSVVYKGASHQPPQVGSRIYQNWAKVFEDVADSLEGAVNSKDPAKVLEAYRKIANQQILVPTVKGVKSVPFKKFNLVSMDDVEFTASFERLRQSMRSRGFWPGVFALYGPIASAVALWGVGYASSSYKHIPYLGADQLLFLACGFVCGAPATALALARWASPDSVLLANSGPDVVFLRGLSSTLKPKT